MRRNIDDEIFRLYKEGKTTQAIKAETGAGSWKVRAALKRKGITNRRLAKDSVYWKNPEVTIFDKQFISQYSAGKTMKEIASDFDVSQTKVRKALIRNGVKMRKAAPISKYTVDHNYFSEIDTEEKAYWLGFITCDGCIHGSERENTKRCVTVALQARDVEHLKKLQKALKSDYPIRLVPRNGAYSFSIRSDKLVSDLRKYGVGPKKSLIMRPYFGLSLHLIRHYIRGLFDANGCITRNKSAGNAWMLQYVGTLPMARLFKAFAEQNTNTRAKLCRNKNCTFMYSFGTGGLDMAYGLSNAIYSDTTIYLERKFEKHLQIVAQFESKRRRACRNN